ncbi:MAG: acetamidase/formamidase family protein [Bacillota bacterium]|nr:acetamidase/formamidase family protein [Bacillota bacterium]
MLVSSKDHVYQMDKNATPSLAVALPARLTFETLDCFAGQLKSETDLLESLDFDHVNPATGPVFFEDVNPGDILKVHIADIRCKSPGIMVAAPDAGLLGHLVQESQTILVPFDKDTVNVLGIPLKPNPMIGVIGLAPSGDPISCGTPGSHGGNMDNTLIAPGTTLFLPVQVEGALLAMGDLHVCMGDGEIMVSGVEVNGEVDVAVNKVTLPLTNPVIVTDTVVATIASADTLDAALDRATSDMANILVETGELSINEAGMLMSACGNAQICQAVDPQKTIRFSMPRSVMKRLGVPLAF